MRVSFCVLALAMSLALSATAHAATIKVVSGDVYRGGADGYDPVDLTAQADVGDSVMAGEYGVGQIIYPNGCVIPVRPGTVITVEAQPPASCQVAVNEATPDWSANLEPTSGGVSTGQILLGAAVGGGVGVGIYALAGGGGSDSSSNQNGGDGPLDP